jgi:hypothetical protein
MRITPARIILMVLVFIAALGGALMLMRSSEPASGGSGNGAKDDGNASAPAAATSDVWKVGDSWTVKVRQDAGAITPDGETNIAEVPYRFQVKEAPKSADGTWLVHVDLDGAEGPVAKGWNLQYADEDGTMVLKLVAVGSEPPLEAELASIVLGQQFPYEVSYTAPPKAKTLDADKLLDRSQLPPGALPSGGTSGAAPPAMAPAPDLDVPTPAG